MKDCNHKNYILAVVMAHNYARNVFPTKNIVVLRAHGLDGTIKCKLKFDHSRTVALIPDPINIYLSFSTSKKHPFFTRDRIQY